MIPIFIREINSKEVLWAGNYWCEPQLGSVIAFAAIPTDDPAKADTRLFAVVNVYHRIEEGVNISVQRVEVHVLELGPDGKPRQPTIITPGTIH